MDVLRRHAAETKLLLIGLTAITSIKRHGDCRMRRNVEIEWLYDQIDLHISF